MGIVPRVCGPQQCATGVRWQSTLVRCKSSPAQKSTELGAGCGKTLYWWIWAAHLASKITSGLPVAITGRLRVKWQPMRAKRVPPLKTAVRTIRSCRSTLGAKCDNLSGWAPICRICPHEDGCGTIHHPGTAGGMASLPEPWRGWPTAPIGGAEKRVGVFLRRDAENFKTAGPGPGRLGPVSSMRGAFAAAGYRCTGAWSLSLLPEMRDQLYAGTEEWKSL